MGRSSLAESTGIPKLKDQNKDLKSKEEVAKPFKNRRSSLAESTRIVKSKILDEEDIPLSKTKQKVLQPTNKRRSSLVESSPKFKILDGNVSDVSLEAKQDALKSTKSRRSSLAESIRIKIPEKVDDINIGKPEEEVKKPVKKRRSSLDESNRILKTKILGENSVADALKTKPAT